MRRITVHNMAESICLRNRAKADDRRVDLHVGFNRHSLHVSVVPDLFEIVLSALIENAVKYSHSGHADRNNRVNIEFGDSPGRLRIVVENRGVRIDRDEIDSGAIFELGYRGKHSQDRQRSGTGSGLFIARQIASSHGAQIDVESQDQGSYAFNRFTLSCVSLFSMTQNLPPLGMCRMFLDRHEWIPPGYVMASTELSMQRRSPMQPVGRTDCWCPLIRDSMSKTVRRNCS
jgi:signal transduction histidine kinase